MAFPTARTTRFAYGLALTSLLLNGCVLRLPEGGDEVPAGETGASSSAAAATSTAPSTTGTQTSSGVDSSAQGSGATSSSGPSSSSTSSSTSGPSSTQSSSSETSSSSDSTSSTSDTQIDPLVLLDQRIDRYAKGFEKDNELLRMRGDVVMAHENKIISQHSYLEKPGQRYAFGSITKTMTAVAILQLEQAGKLKRGDKLRKHIPELPKAFDAITIGHLLAHRSGLGNYLQDQDVLEFVPKGQSREEMIARIAKEAPKFAPGSEILYSNSGYYLLGIVIERSSEQSLSGYFQSYIFGPAKMTESSLWDDGISKGHWPVAGKMEASPRTHPTVSFSAGAACGTFKDLIAFGQALLNGTLLPKKVFQQMIEPTGRIGEFDYGLGLTSFKLSDGRRIIGHDGATFGHRGSWHMSDDGKWNAVVLANMQSVITPRIAIDVLKMAITGKYVEPPLTKALPFDPALAKEMAGDYELDPAKLPELKKSYPADLLEKVKELNWRGDTKYLVKPIGQGEFEVKQSGKDEFQNQAAKIVLKVQREGERVKGINLHQASLMLPYLKKP